MQQASKNPAHVRGPTELEKMVADGTEFIMGTPGNIKKTHGVHRTDLIPKLEPRIELYARKMREMYQREGTISTVKQYLDPIRERLPTDTLESCIQQKVIPGVVSARDEFEDWDMVWPWRTPFNITKAEHGKIKPWYVRHPKTEEEIRVTATKIDYHAKTRLPYWVEFQRYIVGRPNLLRIPLRP